MIQPPARSTFRHGILLALVCGFHLMVASAAAFASGLIPSNSTVVLLSGLPGDVENETSYGQQLEGWLNLLTEHTNHVFVLCENPDGIASRRQASVRCARANRENFLGLTNDLAASTNPLVVIAWGHGGLQGSTPVLHVRGPRLTPDDFRTLAERTSAAESYWVLMFRESGAFASRIAGPHREVLASENGTAFGSDPVGSKLLLKIAQGREAGSFKKLADEFGRLVVAWYSERHLARTEEPTFWAGTEEPRVLALQTGNSETAGSNPAPVVANGNERNSHIHGEETEERNVPTNWKQVRRVQAADYPDADAVVLKQTLTCTLGSSPAITTDQEQFIQILTPAGKEYGDFDLAYDAPEEELEILDCEVLGPNGQSMRLDQEDVGEEREPAASDYVGGSRKFFSVPGVTPGAIVHIRFSTQWKTFPLPQISLALPLATDLPVRDCTLQVKVPKGNAFHFGFRAISPPDPEVTQTAYSSGYTWHLRDLPAQRAEALSPPHQEPGLMISTFSDWAAFAQWYGRISRLTAELTPALKAKATEVTREAKNGREKVLALYNYVSRLRYVAIPMGVNSFRPHNAAHVLACEFGDCKDKANLLNALLHAVDIPADLVLVPRFSQADESLPGLSFNHAISRIKLGEETFWADTTDEVCRFGLLPPGDPGRKVLVIDGGSTLVQLPEPNANDHQLRIRGKLNCSSNGGSWPASLEAVALGYPDYALREVEHKLLGSGRPLLCAGYRPAAGSFALAKQRATAASALEEDFSWHGEGTAVGMSSRAASQLAVHSPVWLPREWDLALGDRHTPLFLNQGYPLTLDEIFELALPTGATDANLPKDAENKDAPLRWKVHWEAQSNNRIAAQFHAELAQGELSAADTPRFQQQLRVLLGALANDALCSIPE